MDVESGGRGQLVITEWIELRSTNGKAIMSESAPLHFDSIALTGLSVGRA